MTKAELRKTYLHKRLSLGESEYLRLNHQISDHFFSSVDLSIINIIHTYLPIEKNKEPDTWLIIDKTKREFPTVRISVPRVRNSTLENFFFEGIHQLEKNTWDILEPKEGISTDPKKIDLVIVPLLAVDQKGNRVGYGKGFYDKFLAQCSPACIKVGLSFFKPIDRIDNTNNMDVALTHCITPEKIYSF